jgi:hypothetical protein
LDTHRAAFGISPEQAEHRDDKRGFTDLVEKSIGQKILLWGAAVVMCWEGNESESYHEEAEGEGGVGDERVGAGEGVGDGEAREADRVGGRGGGGAHLGRLGTHGVERLGAVAGERVESVRSQQNARSEPYRV